MTTVTITCTDLEPYRGKPTSYFTASLIEKASP